jgi:hypothetical protein
VNVLSSNDQPFHANGRAKEQLARTAIDRNREYRPGYFIRASLSRSADADSQAVHPLGSSAVHLDDVGVHLRAITFALLFPRDRVRRDYLSFIRLFFNEGSKIGPALDAKRTKIMCRQREPMNGSQRIYCAERIG